MKRHDDPLGRYTEMRDFGVTNEPAGRWSPATEGRSYVVQEHHARSLHYDFRLEHDGVLWSWAVPKGPSASTKDKRLAVRTEDHPVEYRDFEGTIPKGEYGGGEVKIWDRGTWEPLGDADAMMKAGKLDFVVHGERIEGRFVLIRTAAKNWLLMKRSDDGARAGALPALGSIKPELATLVDDVPTKGDWLFEIKYDGYRAIATLDHGKVRIASRNGLDWTSRFPRIAEALAELPIGTAIVDGEIAYVLPDGRTDFQHLQNALGAKGRAADRLIYFVFDLLHHDGVDLTKRPLATRKEALRALLPKKSRGPIRFGDHVTHGGRAFFAEACRLGLEGIVAKRADSPYRGGRGKDWVKVKCQERQELVVVGFTAPKGSRSDLGALLLGVRDGEHLRYAGKVGTGFTNASLAELRKRLSPLVVEEPAVENAPRMKDAQWVEPELVCQVRFTEWTRDGVLRHPSFEGLREDKPARAVTREGPVSREQKRTSEKPEVSGLVITHPDRVLDDASGITKLDLARYAEVVAPRLLPFATKRPLMLVRCTESFAKGTFVQKHAGRGLVDAIGRGQAGEEEVVFLRDERDVVGLAQNGVVELHGWGSRLPRWERPDWVVFDLDPDPALPFAKVVSAAEELRAELEALGLRAFAKTTGGKGLHVVVPLRPKDDWAVVTAFAAAVAASMAKRSPDAYVTTMAKSKRHGKVFLDRFRNARGATAILPYSARARAGAPVAMPIAWKDLARVDPMDFCVRTVPALLAKRRTDPWADLLSIDQTLPRELVRALHAKR